MTALDELIAVKKLELSDLNKEYRKLKKEEMDTDKIKRKIVSVEDYLRRFRKSNMQPMKVGHITINFKLYERFMKKLNGFKVSQEFEEDSLVITYHSKRANGTLILEDITHHFPNPSKIQVGELHVIL